MLCFVVNAACTNCRCFTSSMYVNRCTLNEFSRNFGNAFCRRVEARSFCQQLSENFELLLLDGKIVVVVIWVSNPSSSVVASSAAVTILDGCKNAKSAAIMYGFAAAVTSPCTKTLMEIVTPLRSDAPHLSENISFQPVTLRPEPWPSKKSQSWSAPCMRRGRYAWDVIGR